MININNHLEPELQKENQEPVAEPDENGGIFVQEFFKISDPESGEIITQGRA